MRASLLLCAAYLGIAWSSTADAEIVRLKFGFANSDTDTIWTTTLKPFIDDVNAEGSGKLVIQAFPNGALGKNLAQQPQLVLDGVADIAFVMPSITPGRFADTEVLELPGLFRSLRESTLVHSALAETGAIDSYHPYVVVAALGSDPFSIHTRPVVASLAELKGKKIRTSSGIQSRVLSALGAAPVFMGFPDVPEAIARGTLDGASIQPVPLMDTNLTRVVSSHYFAGVGTAPLVILMNKSKFEALPAESQELLLRQGKALVNRYITDFGRVSDEIVRNLAADPKRKVTYPSDEDQKRLDIVFRSVTETWTNHNPAREGMLSKLMVELQKLRDGSH